eukprot:CAMPEP_0202972550 /NCGR_PEP_ID=MMETSP1396-20130829/37367_1 /ASSEMBLY_ACC=CAM_ASM_000872 /TAXON_ID= /ORGANISM="Pseudokeronopsis sp., Strain Brazil" /LENGTH=46 /DNA_ID= /DNA_START= /DNA_END= /DNA_ORIENTATION=
MKIEDEKEPEYEYRIDIRAEKKITHLSVPKYCVVSKNQDDKGTPQV